MICHSLLSCNKKLPNSSKLFQRNFFFLIFQPYQQLIIDPYETEDTLIKNYHNNGSMAFMATDLGHIIYGCTISIYMYLFCVYIYIYMQLNIYVIKLHIYIYIYIHTYIHTYIFVIILYIERAYIIYIVMLAYMVTEDGLLTINLSTKIQCIANKFSFYFLFLL